MTGEVAYRLLADLLLLIHFLFVAFVVLGLVTVLIGGLARWGWVRGLWFRLAHLGAIAYVTVQAWLGHICPLTIWENRLRRAAGEAEYPGSFIAYWLEEALYYEAETWVFAVAYTAFGLLVLVSWWLVPPRWRRERESVSSSA